VVIDLFVFGGKKANVKFDLKVMSSKDYGG
jgi:hypothetical protein